MLLFTSVLSVLAACDSHVPMKRATCEHREGRITKALEVIDDFLLKRPREQKALRLREKWAQEVVLVQWFSEPEGALVALDGEELGPTPITVTVDPGRHTFRFTHDGFAPLVREENAVSNTRPKLTAVLDRLPGAPPVEQTQAPAEVAPAPVTSAQPDEGGPVTAAPAAAVAVETATRRSAAPLILGTAGLFAAIGGGVLVLTSLLALDGHTGDANAVTRQYVGFALAGAGVAAGIAAIVWLLIDRRPGASSTAGNDNP